MIKIYITRKGVLEQIDEPEKGCWINLVHPSEKELKEIGERYNIDEDDITDFKIIILGKFSCN